MKQFGSVNNTKTTVQQVLVTNRPIEPSNSFKSGKMYIESKKGDSFLNGSCISIENLVSIGLNATLSQCKRYFAIEKGKYSVTAVIQRLTKKNSKPMSIDVVVNDKIVHSIKGSKHISEEFPLEILNNSVVGFVVKNEEITIDSCSNTYNFILTRI